MERKRYLVVIEHVFGDAPGMAGRIVDHFVRTADGLVVQEAALAVDVAVGDERDIIAGSTIG